MKLSGRVLTIISAFCLVFSLCGCSTQNKPSPSAAPATAKPTPSAAPSAAQKLAEDDSFSRAGRLVQGMTLRQKVGQLFIIRPESLEPSLTPEQVHDPSKYGVTQLSSGMKNTLIKYPVGGIALFGKNLTSPAQLEAFVGALRGAAELPLFFGVDEEGGRVSRLANSDAFQVEKSKSMGDVGATGDPENARKIGLTIGTYLKKYGFNLDFAPVADVNTNPENIVIGDRSFGSDPEKVSKMVNAELDGLRQAKVIGCVKHFPGHGDTKGDTHDGYVSVEKSWEELKACELIPFIGAFSSTDMVMTAHITCPKVTRDGLPSSLSREMIEGKLRGELGYKGIVITDSLAMDAITKEYSSAECAVKAIKAGVDVLLMPDSFTEAFEGVCAAVADGTLAESRIDESVSRILALKLRTGIIS